MWLKAWGKCKHSWLGRQAFRVLIHWFVPYTGSIWPEVLELEPGYAKVQMRDRRRVRNHLHSVHAAALMNFAEITSGIAFLSGLPKDARGIVSSFRIDYLKKARGLLTAESRPNCPQSAEVGEYKAPVEIKNQAGEVVARAEATWHVGPVSK